MTTCDDGGNADQAVACVRTIDKAGVVATVNDQGTAGQADVSQAMQKAKIPRIASNVVPDDWADPNAYPLDASGTGVTFLLPQALIDQGAKKIGLVRVDLAAASAMKSLLGSLYGKKGATFVSDTPVPGGTTDFSQFILAAQNAGADSISISLGEQEAVQVVQRGPAARDRSEDRRVPGHVLAEVGQGSRRLREEHDLRVVVSAGHVRPARVQGAARRPRRIRQRAAPARRA